MGISNPGTSKTDAYTSLSDFDTRPIYRQLIVIGNGFDQACGLKSDFGSFIKARNDFFEPDWQKQGEAERQSSLKFTHTIWDYILAEHEDGNWCDIEATIAEWVIPKSHNQLRAKTLRSIKKIPKQGIYRLDLSKLEDVIAKSYYYSNQSKPGYDTEEALLNFTYQQLLQLEKDFASYLRKEVKNTSNYEENACKLICEIILNERPDQNKNLIEESVLSFNYTRPVKNLHSSERKTTWVNIHGTLEDGETIFGIDGSDFMADQEIVRFTKTYRLMSLNLQNTKDIVKAPTTSYRDKGTAAIKFYGHSLGKADYSYFQALFDTVNLYESKTRLVFYYRPHGNKDETEAKEAMMQKATQLLAAYGLTLDNVDHGKNLIHKLLIEGRLSVNLLPDTVVQGI